MADDKDKSQDTTESPMMKSIREYVLQHNGWGGADQVESQTAMNVDPSSATAKGYADGGVIPDAPDFSTLPIPDAGFDGPTTQSSTYKMQGQVATPPPAAPIPVAVARPAAVAMPTASAAPVAQRPAPVGVPTTAAGSAPAGLADMLAQAQHAGQQAMGQYTPEQRAEMYAYLAQQQNSMPSAIGGGLAAVGDAIARGYGHSESNFLNQTQQNQKDTRTEAAGAFDAGQKSRAQQIEEGMKYIAEDPSSALSKNAQASYGSSLLKLGVPASAVAKMPASMIGDLLGKRITLADAMTRLQLENQYHIGELGIQQQGMGVRQQEVKQKDKELRAQHPVLNKFGMLDDPSDSSSSTVAGLPAVGQTVAHSSGATITRTK